MKKTVEKINKVGMLKVAQVITVGLVMLMPLVSLAALGDSFGCDASSGLNCSAGTNVNAFIKTIINWMLGVAFGVAVLFLIIGGFWYITSAGNEETAEKGKGTVINAIIGIVIIVLSYVIINVVAGLVTTTGTVSAP